MSKVSGKGEAELMIRKGKQSLIYDFELEVEWRGENSENEVEGTFKVLDVNSTDLDFEVMDVKLNKNEYPMLGHACKELLRKYLRGELEKAFKGVVEEVQEVDK